MFKLNVIVTIPLPRTAPTVLYRQDAVWLTPFLESPPPSVATHVRVSILDIDLVSFDWEPIVSYPVRYVMYASQKIVIGFGTHSDIRVAVCI